jgi:23S rRNA (uracil1939-C5)-methyltransferase
LKPIELADQLVIDTSVEGKGIVRHEGQVIFVAGTVPGDVVTLRIFKKHKKYFEADLLSISQSSPDRIEPICKHFRYCGGCKWQHMAYEAQLTFKAKQVEDALLRIGKLSPQSSLPILAAPSPYHYRNKVEFTFSAFRWLEEKPIKDENGTASVAQNALGFHVPGGFNKVLDIDTCYLGDNRIDAIRNAIREYALKNDLPYYHIKAHTGWLRNLLIRTASNTPDYMVVLIISYEDENNLNRLFETLSVQFPFVTAWSWIVNSKLNDSYSELPFYSWSGPGYITEYLGDFQFRISPTSFFQTNSQQAKELYDVVKSYVEPCQTLYDLYCGTGSIGIYLSSLAKQIIGVEYVASSIADAEQNAALNNLQHLQFWAGDLAVVLQSVQFQALAKPDCIVVDPPRSGIDPKVIDTLLRLAAPQLVYVSCNPATQARDLALLATDYDLISYRPVDMFPQTAHVENVVRLAHK